MSAECKRVIKERNRPENLDLPTTADVTRFTTGMRSKLAEALADFEVQTIVHNRKRGRDVELAKLADLESAIAANKTYSEETFAALSPRQQELCCTNFLMTITGKNNNHSFVSMDELMRRAFQVVVDNRDIAHIKPENPFIFARGFSTDGFVRHSPILKSFIAEFDVNNMSTRKMRAYLATTFQVQKSNIKMFFRI